MSPMPPTEAHHGGDHPHSRPVHNSPSVCFRRISARRVARVLYRLAAADAISPSCSWPDHKPLSHQVEHDLVHGVRRLTSATIHTELSPTTPTPPTIWFLTTTDTEGGRSHPARPPSVPSRVRFIGLSVQLPDSRPIARPTPHQPPNLQQHIAFAGARPLISSVIAARRSDRAACTERLPTARLHNPSTIVTRPTPVTLEGRLARHHEKRRLGWAT